MEYKAPDNIYWLFSSSAQAIAAFIGFLTAGFYFVLDKIDDQVIKDSTLDEINQEIKRSHFRKLKLMSYMTGLSIILSLAMVYYNQYDYYLKDTFIFVVSIVNITTISWAILFVISIINPDNINKTAQKLIENNTDLNITLTDHNEGNINIGAFIEKYIELEKKIRELDKTYDLSYLSNGRVREFKPLNEIFKLMFQYGIINNEELINLREVNKIRNLAAHGQINTVDKRVNDLLNHLINIITIRIKNKEKMPQHAE